MVCLGNMCMDTVHKGDNDDDDDDDDNNNNTIPLSKHSNALMFKPENDLWSHVKWWCI